MIIDKENIYPQTETGAKMIIQDRGQKYIFIKSKVRKKMNLASNMLIWDSETGYVVKD